MRRVNAVKAQPEQQERSILLNPKNPMKLHKYLTSAACLLTLVGGASAATFTGADVGTPTLPGSSAASGGTITVKASGDDIWNSADSFQYYYTPVQGLVWDAVVRVQSLDAPVSTWAKCELMVRQDNGSGTPVAADPFIGMATTAVTLSDGTTAAQNMVETQWRATRGSGCNNLELSPAVRPGYPNQWLRVQRNGSVFTMYYGSDGVNWSQYQQIDTSKSASASGGTSGFDGNAWSDPILVGVAVTAHDNSALATAVVSDLSITTHPLPQPPTVLKASTDVKSVSTTAGNPVAFNFAATNNANPVVPVSYQWYRNDQVVSNVTGTAYSFLSSAGDNGAKVYCKASIPSWDNPNNLPALYSTTGTVTLTASTLYTNGLKREVFPGANRVAVEQGNVGLPSTIQVYPSFQMPANDNINDYAQRVSGWFIAPTTASYNFFVCSDDDADLFVSSDSTAAKKQLVAQETAWSNPGEWTTSSGGSDTAQKRSDQYSPDGMTRPFAAGISMTAGQLYYIEGVQHQGTGGDNFSVMYSIWGELEPTNDAPVNLTSTNHNVVFATGPSTKLTISKNPQSELIYEGQSAFFTVETSSDSELTPYYQWYRNDQPIANANSSSYSFVASVATDNGAKFFVTVNSELGGIWATSTVATLTVQSAIFEPGFLQVDHAPAAEPTEAQIQAGDIGTVAYSYATPAFEAGVNNGTADYYGRRVSGYFIPATTGNYSFITCSDDQNALFLSQDDTPAKKVWIAYESQWSNPRQWNTYEGGTGSDAQKHSDTFVNPTTSATPYPNGVPLTGGKRYYIEADMREGNGGDNIEATFYKTGDASPADGTLSALTGNLIGMNAPRCTYVAFTNQPVSVTLNSLGTATFTAGGTTDSKTAVGGTGIPNLNNFMVFQWTKNGTAIAGATASSYTTPPVGPWDNNAQIVCKLRALGYADTAGTPIWSNSTPAVLAVNADTTPPAIVYAGYYTFTNLAGVGLTYVTVEFNKLMDPSTLILPSNYSIPGLTVTSALVNSNNYSSVKLTVTGTPTFPVSVTLSGIKDGWGTVPATSVIALGKAGLISQDIGTVGTGTANDDPVFPSTMWVDGTNAYTIVAQGSDIWAQRDGCNFAYEVRTGDFDVAVRQKSITHTSQWAKGGLMVRESLEADSRNWNIINDPRSSDGIAAPDGSGFGANVIECNWRTNGVGTGAESTGWDIIARTNAPTYPNAWLRLTRTGSVLKARYGSDGINWLLAGVYDVSTNADNPVLPQTVYVGICTTAHNNDSPSTTSPLYWNTAQYADYMSVYVAPAGKPTLTIGQQGGVWKITYTGTLQSSPAAVNGTWTDVSSASSPYTVPVNTGTMQFYRSRN
jgi:hypothetical protein